MDELELERWEHKIDGMTHVEMARLWRFAPSGHPCFDKRLSLSTRFEKRFKELGGMTSAISKQIEW